MERRRTSTRRVELPHAPTAREPVLYVDASNRLLSLTPLIGWLGLSAALLLFSLNSIWLFPFTIWVVLGVAYFLLSYLANTTFRRFDLAEHDRLVAEWKRRQRPAVDVFLPNCGEELAVLANTFAHIAGLEYPGHLTIYCLDDVGRPEVEELAHRYGFVYLSRPNKGEYKKAGNLRHAYLRSHGDFIVVFDADFCPRRDFLTELLPYALADETVGIVQSRSTPASTRRRTGSRTGPPRCRSSSTAG